MTKEEKKRRARIANRKFYMRHRKAELRRSKKWRKEHPNYQKQWAEANKDKRAAACRKSEYGILPHEYDAKLKKQKGLCAICKRKMKRPDVDHNHRTGRIRDLLCHGCNTFLGLAGESIKVLKNAIQYLRRHNGLECQSRI